VIPALRKTGPLVALDLVTSLAALAVLVALGVSAPSGVHPLFYFGLIFVGGAAFGLLISGVIVSSARGRQPTSPQADTQFFAGVRRGVLAMWLCALVSGGFGVLILLAIAGGRGSTPVGAGPMATVLTLAVLLVACAVVTSVVVRRAVPKR